MDKIAIGLKKVRLDDGSKRVLLLVPRFYNKQELELLLNKVPDDYEEKSEEFWNFVKEKLDKFINLVNRVYHESVDKDGVEGLKTIHSLFDEREYRIVKTLIDHGAHLHATEDAILIMETASWLRMMAEEPDLKDLKEFLEDSLKARAKYSSEIINTTLKKGEVGLVIIEPARKLILQKDITVIRICRFDPQDCLKAWITRIG